MNRALERWFTQMPENVVRQAREIQTEAVADQSAKLTDTAQMLASVLEKRELTDNDLTAISNAGNLSHIEILNKNNKVLRAAGKSLSPEQQAELDDTLSYARSGQLSEPLLRDGKGFDAAVAELSDGRKLVIVPDIQRDASVSDIVDNSLREFDLLKEQNNTVRQIGLSTLGVLTFLLIFASSWTAIYVARGLTGPIKALAEGADEIAKGKLGHKVDVLAEDELAILVESFNQMSARLEENAAALSRGRRYTETVLQSLPTGVISVDEQNRVSTINRAAIRILCLETADFSGLKLGELVNEENRVVLERLVNRAMRVGHASEQTTLKRETMTGRSDPDDSLPVALIATGLPGDNGAVIVIEDLSDLISAQRAAAWQEVARRMAHEIKNPLTPIQLSAERIAKKCAIEPAAVTATGLPAAPAQTAKIIKDGTDIILREVQSLKAMVDEFSRFARLPDATLEPGSLNDVVTQVLAGYEDRFDDIRISVDLDPDLPEAMIDAEQLKRVFVNIIENAIEAFDNSSDDKQIVVRTRSDRASDTIIAEVSDNGPGIDPRDFQKLFQPYFSTTGRGTGLGLAIVHRIVSDHRGKIKAAENKPTGARFVIELPLAS
jgi:PAS domain S-box-containing protein